MSGNEAERPTLDAAPTGSGRRASKQDPLSLPAADAGLTSFEPITEPITLLRECAEWRGVVANWTKVVASTAEFPDLNEAAAEAALSARPELTVRVLCDTLKVHLARALAAGRKPRNLRDTIREVIDWAGELKAGETGRTSFAATAWSGPAELREALAREGQCGEGFCRSYLDHSAWDEATRVVTPRGKTAYAAFCAAQRRRTIADLFDQFNVRLGEPE